MSMYCYQCQEAAKNVACTKNGVCGKHADVANLQDLLTYQLKGISLWAVKARAAGVTDSAMDLFVVEGLFATVTNVNFDGDWFEARITEGQKVRDAVQAKYLATDGAEAPTHDSATFTVTTRDEMLAKAETVGVLSEENEDLRSLKELLMYGLKGMAAYVDNAYILGAENPELYAFTEKALAEMTREDVTGDELTALVLECGAQAVTTMALLDKANTETFGTQAVSEVDTSLVEGPGILISGHDLKDLAELLEQTKDTGINIYTHSEMLPAHAYGELNKYDHLKGNYGMAWHAQHTDFVKFTGAILMTTNCIKKPKDEYKDRLFTTGLVEWPGLVHIADRAEGSAKDFSAVIAKAKELGSITAEAGKKITIGFAKDQVMAVADKVIEAVKSGAIKRFVVMAGCDGHQDSRNYYTELAEKLPKDMVILTAGCAKYRYNMLDLGDIGGIPRVLDAGQCNDSYSLAYIALQLKDAFGLEDINQLPISYEIAWYEQKAVVVLLALLSLGVKGIRLGPTLPAFLSPGVAQVLVDGFGIKGNGTPDEAIAEMLAPASA
ncbi:Hydroxylamine reductase [hydrothermal vent metagenome]|uniref:Hydroxylamine reductase n=1 Tax=hydrothermal vent metagenome TaxID=652676 RepID=A0A3B0QW17_9ZZZZ